MIKVQLLVDDTVRRITDIWQRGQLTAQDLPGLARLAEAAGDLYRPTPFPEVRR